MAVSIEFDSKKALESLQQTAVWCPQPWRGCFFLLLFDYVEFVWLPVEFRMSFSHIWYLLGSFCLSKPSRILEEVTSAAYEAPVANCRMVVFQMDQRTRQQEITDFPCTLLLSTLNPSKQGGLLCLDHNCVAEASP